MLEIFLFLVLGIILGIVMGLIPGVHPNMIVLLVPLFAALSLNPFNILALIISMGITNSFVDFVPSIMLGAADPGKELSVLPGHRLLSAGHGYEAVKLAVVGGLGAVILVSLLLPVLLFAIPVIYDTITPHIYLLLIFVVLLMVLSENGKKKMLALLVFFLSGLTGIMTSHLPVDSTIILFPIFSGYFGASMLLLQIRRKTALQRQTLSYDFVSKKTVNRSVISGTLGGVASGFLPGIGSSEIATLATVDKNDRSFLLTIGALTSANMILSVLSLYLISHSRSGLAVAISQLITLTFADVIFIVALVLVASSVSVVVTLVLARVAVNYISKINYAILGKFVIAMIVIVAFIFTGPLGIFLLAVCTALGVLTNFLGIKRGNLMGVLILPTILFYAGL